MAPSLADILVLLLQWLGWLPVLRVASTCKTVIRPEVQCCLQQDLDRHAPALWAACNFRLQIKQLFTLLVQPFLDLASSHPPRPPFALVRPERRVHCRYYNARKWKYLGRVTEGSTEDLGRVFPHGGFEAGFQLVQRHGTHLDIVYHRQPYNYCDFQVLEEWTSLYFVFDGMFELRLIMRYAEL